MAEKKRFIIIEDLEFWQTQIHKALEASGHIIVDRATTLADALKLVQLIKDKKITIDAVTLDGNLRSTAPDGYKPGDDGRQILKALRKAAPRVKVIGMSLDHMDEVDENVGKPPEFRLRAHLDSAINNLFRKRNENA